MGEIKRLYPEAKTALINWIEQNFHEIDSYVAIFKLKDGTTMTVHHVDSYVEGVGLAGVLENTLHVEAYEGTFTPKPKEGGT